MKKFCKCSLAEIQKHGFQSIDGVFVCKKCGLLDRTNYLVEEALPVEGGNQNVSLKDLVAAQDRTTHAVRALAFNFIAAPLIFLAVVALIAIAVSSGNTGFTVFALIFGFVAFIITLVSTLDELRKSKI
jgi:hypothetical protein